MTKAELLSRIRRKCLECSAGSRREVKDCVIPECPLFPLRFGKDPTPGRKGNTKAFQNPKEAENCPSVGEVSHLSFSDRVKLLRSRF